MNLTKRITGVIALVAILLLLAGVPMLLWWLGQPFIPTAVPDLGQAIGVLFRRDDGSVVVLLIYLVAWIAWLYLSIAVLVEGWAAIRRIPAPQLPGFRLPQGIAKHLVAAALLAFVATPAIANANPVPPPAVATQPAVTTTTALPATITDDTPQAPNVVKHTVGPEDSLWNLAEHYLGDPNRYPEIFDANKGIIQANGTRLTNPDVIVDGTVLMIPTAPEAPAPEPAAPEAPAPVPATAAAPGGGGGGRGGPGPRPGGAARPGPGAPPARRRGGAPSDSARAAAGPTTPARAAVSAAMRAWTAREGSVGRVRSRTGPSCRAPDGPGCRGFIWRPSQRTSPPPVRVLTAGDDVPGRGRTRSAARRLSHT